MKTLIATPTVSAGNANAYVHNSGIHKANGYVNKAQIQTTTTVRHEPAVPFAQGQPLTCRIPTMPR
jgi:hypothetical protein